MSEFVGVADLCMHGIGCCYYLGKHMQVNLTFCAVTNICSNLPGSSDPRQYTCLSVLPCVQTCMYITMMYLMCALLCTNFDIAVYSHRHSKLCNRDWNHLLLYIARCYDNAYFV